MTPEVEGGSGTEPSAQQKLPKWSYPQTAKASNSPLWIQATVADTDAHLARCIRRLIPVQMQDKVSV